MCGKRGPLSMGFSIQQHIDILLRDVQALPKTRIDIILQKPPIMLDGLWTHVSCELFEPAGRDIYEGRGVGHPLEKSGAPCWGAPENRHISVSLLRIRDIRFGRSICFFGKF